MRKKITFLRHFIAFLLTVLFINASAQDWVTQSSKLYYFGSKGKVQLEPDFNAMAVYFEDDEVSQEASQKFKAKLSFKSTGVKDFEVMDRKGIIRIKSASSLQSIKTPKERADFLKSENLLSLGAYEVLPAFKVGGKQVWFTKRVTIRLKEGVSLEDISAILEKYDAVFIKNITNANTYLLKVNKIQNQLPFIQELGGEGVLKWGEPDFKVDLVRSTNDPMYGDSWHLNNTGGSIDGKALVADIDVNAPEAWNITTGVSSVVVAVIDDGLEAHEDMATLLTGYTPANGGNGTPSLSDDGHGQQVAGLIGAQHNNIGAAGIAPGVSIFSVNIFSPNTTNADVADGITWAVNNGADVLSNSWGFGSCTYNDASITDAFAYAATNGRNGLGCIILIASGNDFQTCVSYPANLSNVTAVGGISGDGARSMYSNYGPALDIVAPSDDDWVQQGGQWYSTGTHGLRTTDRMGSAGWYSGNYSEAMGGTSGATPQVSAVAALVLSVNPNLTKSEVENILYTTAKDMGNANELGAGIVDAHGAVLAAGGTSDNEDPTVPTGLASSNIGTTSFDISWNASSDNVAVTGYEVYVGGSLDGTTASTSYNVSGLTASTVYSIGVLAKDAAGNSSSQATINVTTLDPVGGGCEGGITAYPYSQGFEGSIGDWTQDANDDLDWTVDANGTPSSSTGPSSATEGTYYIYVESSTNGTGYPNKVAIINSPCFDLTAETAASFNFSYHMYGSTMGTLELQASTDGTNWTNLWSLSGNQGNAWNDVAVDLTDYTGASVQLRYVGTTSTSYTSDMAIDDISLTTGSTPTLTDLSLTITFDNYPEETSWTLVNSGGTTVASGGTYGSQADGSTLVIPINGLPNDCYDFTILDSYGDGICCAYGNGSYTLETTGGTLLASGGSFADSQLTNFCLNGPGINAYMSVQEKNTDETIQKSFNVYPNPAKEVLNITAVNFDKNAVIRITDVTGSVKYMISLKEMDSRSLDISKFEPGLYFISILGDNDSNKNRLKFIKQ